MSNPKVQWGIWVDNSIEDNYPHQWFGQGHPDYLYPSMVQAQHEAFHLGTYFGLKKYSVRKYAKRS